MNYIAAHKEIPLHSKIVARVFFNASSHQGKLGKDGLRNTPALHTFMIQFSETHPLFDFLDCGSGRERADSKIKQNFELFIDNPYCRAMFLAVCYDGGFVRMLEPYQHSDDAVTKVVLIKAGQVAPGFTSVPLFRFAEFKSVFREQYSLKIGSIERTVCAADELKPTDVQFGETLCRAGQVEAEDLPIGNIPCGSWAYSRARVHPTTTLLGIAYEATLPVVESRGALPTPGLIALGILSFRLRGSNHSAKISPKVDGKKGTKRRIHALECAIRQKKRAAQRPGTSSTLQKILQLTTKSLEDDLAQLKRKAGQRTKSN